MSVNQQNSSFVMSFADKMQQGFWGHSLTNKIPDQKITSYQTPNIFDSSTNIAQKNIKKNGHSDYQQIEQEYKKIEFIEKFQKKAQHAMSKAKDHLELYRIYQTNLKEIEEQFKDNLQNTNEEFKKLTQDHQNKITKINKDYYDLLEIKKTENLDFLEMIKTFRSELEIAENQKFEDFKEFKKKLSDLAKIRDQQISDAREKAKETGVYPYEISEIIEQSELLKDKITKDFLDLKESSEQIIKNKSNKFDELLEIQKKLAKQDHKNNNDLSQNKEDSIAKQIQTYSASQDQINKKLSQHQELYENSKKILITLFENFRENIDKKNFNKPLDPSSEEDNSVNKFLERIKPEEIEYATKSSTSKHSQPKNLFVSPPTNPRIKKKRLSKKDQFTRHL